MDVRSSFAGPYFLGPTKPAVLLTFAFLFFLRIRGQQNKNFVDLSGG